MKVICIYHKRDLDGWMSAAIVKKASINSVDYIVEHNKENEYGKLDFQGKNGPLNTLWMLGWDYGDPIPNLVEFDKAIICDVSFSYEEMAGLGTELIWIDHHKSAIEEVERGLKRDVGFIEGLRDTKFAACELTWKYFFPNEAMPEIVRLLGRYDCFGHKGTNEEQKVLEFQYGARQVISNYEDAYGYLNADYQISGDATIDYIWDKGIAIYDYLKTEAKQIYKKAFPIELWEPRVIETPLGKMEEGNTIRTFLCVNQERFNPINFGIDYHKDGYDGFACFWYKDGKWSWSLYNDNGEVDCSNIAKEFKGGGHKGAAGFVCATHVNSNLMQQVKEPKVAITSLYVEKTMGDINLW